MCLRCLTQRCITAEVILHEDITNTYMIELLGSSQWRHFTWVSLNKNFKWVKWQDVQQFNTSHGRHHLTLGKLQPPGVISWLVSMVACNLGQSHGRRISLPGQVFGHLSQMVQMTWTTEKEFGIGRDLSTFCCLLLCDAQINSTLTGWNQNSCVQLSIWKQIIGFGASAASCASCHCTEAKALCPDRLSWTAVPGQSWKMAKFLLLWMARKHLEALSC